MYKGKKQRKNKMGKIADLIFSRSWEEYRRIQLYKKVGDSKLFEKTKEKEYEDIECPECGSEFLLEEEGYDEESEVDCPECGETLIVE